MFDCSGNEQPGLYEISRKPPKPTSAGALTADQQMMLNQIKKQAAQGKAGANRSVQEAEQDLWTLTAANQPGNAQLGVSSRALQ